MQRSGPKAPDQRHHGKGRDEGYRIVECGNLAIGQNGGMEGAAMDVRCAIDGAADRIDRVGPVPGHADPLEQAHQAELAHRDGHVGNRFADLTQGGPSALGLCLDVRALLRRQRQFGNTQNGPKNCAERKHSADHEHDAHGVGDAVAVDPVLVHAKADQQRGREEGQHLGKAGECALRQETRLTLFRVQPVGDICQVRLHGDVVARVEDP